MWEGGARSPVPSSVPSAEHATAGLLYACEEGSDIDHNGMGEAGMGG